MRWQATKKIKGLLSCWATPWPSWARLCIVGGETALLVVAFRAVILSSANESKQLIVKFGHAKEGRREVWQKWFTSYSSAKFLEKNCDKFLSAIFWYFLSCFRSVRNLPKRTLRKNDLAILLFFVFLFRLCFFLQPLRSVGKPQPKSNLLSSWLLNKNHQR